MNEKPNEVNWTKVWRFLWSHKEFVSFLFGLIVGLISAFLWLDARITNTARQAVLSEDFLNRLAKEVRPTCIFDSNGTILADLGASDYIENIRVVLQPSSFGMDVYADCKRHLAYAPIVTCLNSGIFVVEAVRTPPNGWKYSVRPSEPVQLIASEGNMPTNFPYQFKLEILH
jgi:hypothetical protein